jgi:uncharacterized protein
MKPWGYWATLGWAALAFAAGQIASLAPLLLWRTGDLHALLERPFDGVTVTLAILAANPVMIAIAVVAAWLARWNVATYLGFVWPPTRSVLQGLLGIAVLIAGFDGFLFLTGHPLVTPFQLESYKSAAAEGWLAAMWIAAVIVAPVGEEVLFRGLLFRGWVQPSQSAWVGIVAISLAWALPHVQYDLFGVTEIFIVGLFLGFMRWRSGSTLLTCLLHALFNLEGTAETALQVHFFS